MDYIHKRLNVLYHKAIDIRALIAKVPGEKEILRMPISLESLPSDDRKLLHGETIGVFLDGECYAFAIALHRGLSLPMVGLIVDGVIRHAAVKLREDVYFDSRGEISLREFGAPFARPPYAIQAITEEDLRNVRPVPEQTIALARRRAESLWPDLSWENSAQDRVLSFATELEELSRKQGIWIRSPFPAARPMLAFYTDEDDEKVTYTLYETCSSTAYSIERTFE